jgi:hypothetical protein
MNRFKGSIRSATVASTSLSSAVGIWTQTEVMQAKQAGVWPNAGAGGSVLFNQSTASKQSFTISTAPLPSTSEFTIEAYVKLLSSSLATVAAWGTGTGNFRFFINDPAKVLQVWNGSSLLFSSSVYSTSLATLGTWNHVVAQRRVSGSNSIIEIFLNGTVVGTLTTTTATTSNFNAGTMQVATDGSNPAWANMTSFRYVLGSAVYTSGNFTPSTIPLTAVTNTQLLLLAASSGTLTTDSSSFARTVTNNNGATWSALTPF